MGWFPDLLGTLAATFRVGAATLDASGLSSPATFRLPANGGEVLTDAMAVPRLLAVTAQPLAVYDTTTNAQMLFSCTIPGGLLGTNGSLLVDLSVSMTAVALPRIIQTRLGGYSGGILQYISLNGASLASWRGQFLITNRGVANSQLGLMDSASYAYSPGSTPFLATAVDTGVDQDLVVLGAWSAVGDGSRHITLERVMVQFLPGP